MIVMKEPEIRARIRKYTTAHKRDGQTEVYYKVLEALIYELKCVLGEAK